MGGVLQSTPPPAVDRAVNLASDVLSFLLIVRLGKLIGSDRDRIIASKIRDACKVYPVRCSLISGHEAFTSIRMIFLACVSIQGTDVVVVVGMLHCNGVARWLLSGVDPLVR